MFEPDRQFLKKYLLLVSVIWLLLTILVMYYGALILKPSLYYFSQLGELLIDGFSIKMHDSLLKGESIIIMMLKSEESIRTVNGAVLLSPGMNTPVFAYTTNILVPAVILMSLILAWPFASIKQYFTAIVIGLVFTQLILILTVPFQLLGIFENQLIEIASKANDSFPFSYWHYWQMFCDGGAVWMMAILAAMITIAVARRIPVQNKPSTQEA